MEVEIYSSSASVYFVFRFSSFSSLSSVSDRFRFGADAVND